MRVRKEEEQVKYKELELEIILFDEGVLTNGFEVVSGSAGEGGSDDDEMDMMSL